MKGALIALSSLIILMLAGCQTSAREEFDPEAAALARMRLGLGYLAKANIMKRK